MKKKLKHAGILAVVFILAILYFEYRTSKGNDNMIADIGNVTLPRLYFSVEGYRLNAMNGYTKEMEIASIRDSITPVANNQLAMRMEAEERKISSVDYAVYSIDGETKLYENRISTASEEMTLTFDEGILAQERVMRVTLHSDTGDIFYYTRVVTPVGFSVASCLDYVYNFHENALAKKENTGVGAALEPNDESDNSTLAHVTIHSNYDQVTWGALEPQVTGEERWKILETNAAYTSVLLEYEVDCKGEENETDSYAVREFYRVRMAEGTMYLLNYDRNMEQLFDGSRRVLDDKGLLLGIVSPDVPYMVNSEGNIVAFVQANELWNYNRDEGVLSLIFSFRDVENTDSRSKNSEHNIQILGMDKKGNITFAVAGYMNRGKHEGQVGVDIYYYNIETNSIEEKVFIPSNKSAGIAEKEFGKFAYYSVNRDYLYMMVGGTLYEVDVDKNWDEPVISDLKEGQYAMSESGRWFAWQTGSDMDVSQQVVVKDLDLDEEYEVEAAEGESIIPLGFVGDDFVFGRAKQSDVGETITGEKLVPMYLIEIHNAENELVKSYDAGEYYIIGAEVDEGMITLHRAVKNGGTYAGADADYITSSEEKEESNITLESYVTDLKKRQMRFTFADGIQEKDVKVLKPKRALHDDPALPEFEEEAGGNGYCVYGLGKLQGIYEEAGEAILTADSMSGVVIAPNGQYVWERGNRYLMYQITGQDELMAFIQNQLQAGRPPLEIANELSGDKGVELTGCSAEQIAYLINKGTPVIGVRNGDVSLILTGYDEHQMIYINSADGQIQTMPKEQMDQIMLTEGNEYIGYLP